MNRVEQAGYKSARCLERYEREREADRAFERRCQVRLHYWCFDVVTAARRMGRSIEDLADYFEIKGPQPRYICAQDFVELMSTLGYDVTQPYAPLKEWRLA